MIDFRIMLYSTPEIKLKNGGKQKRGKRFVYIPEEVVKQFKYILTYLVLSLCLLSECDFNGHFLSILL